MCDTFAFKHEHSLWFAKNSDREPDEPQRVEYIAPCRDDQTPYLSTTYLQIEQVARRHGYLMGRTIWMWGAEMGVNDQGVAIGNEAIFTATAATQPTALLGMDLVRLGLERAASADEALSVITDLLKRYGQGGPAGYRNKKFRYDNSFLIADKQTLWQLETSGRDWVSKQFDVASISNALQLTGQYHNTSTPSIKQEDFSRRQSWFMPFMAKAKARQACTYQQALALSQAQTVEPQQVMDVLRSHRGEKPASNADVCMHAKGFLRPTGTTNSMVARLTAKGPEVWFTGTSLACESKFISAQFSAANAQYFSEQLWIRHRQALKS
ncbi:dipeptidase [Simiduia litorea]|uniref:C69 family dipeptidase n=1 Tax=Simiduia litorea TaxID=1435348 RepID=UPI0036F41C9B